MHHKTGRNAHRWCALLVATAFLVAACGSDSDPSTDGSTTTTVPTGGANRAVVNEMAADVLETNATVAESLYRAALDGAARVRTSVGALLAEPSDGSIEAARTAWLEARPAYLHTEGLRFAGGPIDSGDNPEGFMNAWPLDEQYIDSIIDGTDPISPDALRSANERGGEKNISTGWHAIEYLLWGKDGDPAGPGNRPATDFDAGSPANERRREYLRVVSDMLVEDLTGVAEQWSEGSGTYREQYTALAVDGLRQTLTGIGTLSGGELYGERISVPYETKDAEDEHSCFSDNTTVDHLGDVESIRHIYLGLQADDTRTTPALSDLAEAIDPKLDERIRTALEASIAATGAIPAPFDQAILGSDDAPGRTAIRDALAALNEQTEALIALATAMGVQIGTEVP